ncbi:MAG: nicotinamide mononucleotide transporter family protein, partial [Phycicoccus sp.]
QVFVALWNLSPNPFWTPQWWFYWCDAWIFVGSVVATYAMARGWNEFWLAWIGVDLVGVPLGFATGYVPTAVMYIFYGAFVVYGFTRWVAVTREASRVPSREAGDSAAVG